VKTARLARLQALLGEHQRRFAEGCVGGTVEILLEKPGRQQGQLVGRSPWLQPVIVDAKALQIGDSIQVRITAAGSNSLFAEQV